MPLQLDTTIRDRWETVEITIAAASPPPPKPTAPTPPRDSTARFPGFGALGAAGQQYKQQMWERKANMTGPVVKAASWATGLSPQPSAAPTWADNARGPGVPSKAAFPGQQGSHYDQTLPMASFAQKWNRKSTIPRRPGEGSQARISERLSESFETHRGTNRQSHRN